MQIGDQLAKGIDTCPLVEALRFSPDVQQCAHEMWINLFEFYFDFLGLTQYYTFKMNKITSKEKAPGKDYSKLRKSVMKDVFQIFLSHSK